MAYIVGLTATDGCLYTGLRKINFKSNDRELVELYLRILGRTNRVKEQKTRKGNIAFFTEFGDARLYAWFLSIGLTPRKSLTLGAIDVPDAHLLPLIRGLLDGDGSIQNFVHHPTLRTAPEYTYERLWVRFTSASRAHIDWISASLARVLSITGSVSVARRPGRNDFFDLRFGNAASVVLLRAIYPTPDVPRLGRKFDIWARYTARHGC